MDKRRSRKKAKNARVKDLEEAAVEKVMRMIKQGVHPAAIVGQVETEARKIAERMTPAEKALSRYPDATLVGLDEVPSSVVEDHLTRYTKDELQRGQFILVKGSKKHYVFFMDKKTKERLEKGKPK